MLSSDTGNLQLFLVKSTLCSAKSNGALYYTGDIISAASIKLILSTDGTIQKYAWPQPDGKFAIHNVPAGSHLLDVAAVGLVYPQVRQQLVVYPCIADPHCAFACEEVAYPR